MTPRRFHDGNITAPLPDDHIFVFGSNLAGRHGAGAALYAMHNFGAVYHIGEGQIGSSYALPTKDHHIQTRSLEDIGISAQRFMKHAADHPDLTFLLTAVGCGYAGLKPEDVAPLFVEAPDNVVFPPEFMGKIVADFALERVRFEDTIYQSYFISHVGNDMKLKDGLLTKAELFAHDPNDYHDYERPDISAMWFGWQRALGVQPCA